MHVCTCIVGKLASVWFGSLCTVVPSICTHDSYVFYKWGETCILHYMYVCIGLSALKNLAIYIRCHSSDVYLGMSPIQNGGFYVSNVLVYIGKSSKTVASWNN